VGEPRVCASVTGFTGLLEFASCSSSKGTPAAIRLETKDQGSLDGRAYMLKHLHFVSNEDHIGALPSPALSNDCETSQTAVRLTSQSLSCLST
jgi:hypothetical protein